MDGPRSAPEIPPDSRPTARDDPQRRPPPISTRQPRTSAGSPSRLSPPADLRKIRHCGHSCRPSSETPNSETNPRNHCLLNHRSAPGEQRGSKLGGSRKFPGPTDRLNSPQCGAAPGCAGLRTVTGRNQPPCVRDTSPACFTRRISAARNLPSPPGRRDDRRKTAADIKTNWASRCAPPGRLACSQFAPRRAVKLGWQINVSTTAQPCASRDVSGDDSGSNRERLPSRCSRSTGRLTVISFSQS